MLVNVCRCAEWPSFWAGGNSSDTAVVCRSAPLSVGGLGVKPAARGPRAEAETVGA